MKRKKPGTDPAETPAVTLQPAVIRTTHANVWQSRLAASRRWQHGMKKRNRSQLTKWLLAGVVFCLVLVLLATAAKHRLHHAVPPQHPRTTGHRPAPARPRAGAGRAAPGDQAGATLTLDPPNPTHLLRLTLTDHDGNPLPGVTVVYHIVGPHPRSGTAVTNAAGQIAFAAPTDSSYTLAVHAMLGGVPAAARVIRVTSAPAPVATGPVLARFYTSANRCVYDQPTWAQPVLTAHLPTLNLAGRPLLAGANGTAYPLVGPGITIGEGALSHFDAVLTGVLSVRAPTTLRLDILVDDAYTLGIGKGAHRIAGDLIGAPEGGLTALDRLPVVAAYNRGHLEIATFVVLAFPHPGTYPYEVDWDECRGGGEAVRVSGNGRFLAGTGNALALPVATAARPRAGGSTGSVSPGD